MTTTKSLLFDEEEFIRRNRYKVSQVHRNSIINGEDDAYIQVNLTQRVLAHLEDKFLNFLKGKALPF